MRILDIQFLTRKTKKIRNLAQLQKSKIIMHPTTIIYLNNLLNNWFQIHLLKSTFNQSTQTFKLTILVTIKTQQIHHFKSVKNKDKEDTLIHHWNKIIQIVMQVIVKNTLIMDLLFIKIQKELLHKKINLTWWIFKEKEAILFTILGKLQIKKKSKTYFNTNQIRIISCKIS